MREPQRWQRRPAEVDAMLVSHDNTDEVALWSGGRAAIDPQTEQPTVRLPNSVVPARPGDYIVRDVMPDGAGPPRVMKPDVFEWAYSKVIGTPRRHRARTEQPDAPESPVT